MNSNVRESLIGLAAAGFSIFVLLVLMGGRMATAFADAAALMLFVWIGPLFYLYLAPWLLVVYALAGFLIFRQYRHVPIRFVRYVVGAEAVVWQLFGIWCVGNLAGGLGHWG